MPGASMIATSTANSGGAATPARASTLWATAKVTTDTEP